MDSARTRIPTAWRVGLTLGMLAVMALGQIVADRLGWHRWARWSAAHPLSWIEAACGLGFVVGAAIYAEHRKWDTRYRFWPR